MIESRVIKKRIVVISTIQGVIIRAIAAPVNGELAESALDGGHARGFDRRTRDQSDQFPEVTPVEGQIGHQPLVDHFAQDVPRIVHQGGRGSDCDLFFPLLNRGEIEIRGSIQTHIDNDVLRRGGQTSGVGGNHIVARRQFSENIAAVLPGCSFTHLSGGNILRADFRASDDGVVGVNYLAANRASVTLGTAQGGQAK